MKPGLKKPDLLKACKLEPHFTVFDATAGFGRDAALLAASGANVLMCEREPLLAALLDDALKRLSPERQLKLQLIHDDAKTYLQKLKPADYPDVIYLDPMHPKRDKSARVKKDLYALQQYLGPDEDVLELLRLARAHVKRRVILKWPVRQPALLTPNYTVSGKTIRFDVYLESQQILVDDLNNS